MNARKYFVIISLLLVSLAVTGCVKKADQKQRDNEFISEAEGRGEGRNMMGMDFDNFSEASLDDLEVGTKISVMGQKNPDGSITAENIIIGAADFPNMGERMRPLPDEINSGQERPAFQFPEGDRPNMENFKNLSEEEREKFREEMMANGGFAGRGGELRVRPSGEEFARTAGEIISKDENSMVLKLNDGGSAIILLSGQTKIRTPKEQ